MSLQFCSFLVRRKNNYKNQFYSYMDPLETMKSYDSGDESEEEDPNPACDNDFKWFSMIFLFTPDTSQIICG